MLEYKDFEEKTIERKELFKGKIIEVYLDDVALPMGGTAKRELVKDPKRLPEASQFLYTHLPNIVDLTDNYVEINGHEVKSKEVYGKLEESAQIIDQMADLIVKDYQQFVAEDLEDMDVEISIAKKNLDQDSDLTTKLKTKNS